MSGLPTLYLKGNLIATKWSESQDDLDKQVPLDYIMNWFDERIPQEIGGSSRILARSPADKILILRSSTGSGKSTIIPPELYHLFFKRLRKNIACTQPRRLTAIEIPREGIPPYHTKEKLAQKEQTSREPIIFGKNIGTQTGIFVKKPTKGIIFMTAGVITQQLNVMTPEEFMQKYFIIIIDEAHERAIEIDLVLYTMKKFIYNNWENKDCPFLLVMSATFDVVKYADYLLSEIPTSERYKNIIDVKGSTYEIKENFLKEDTENVQRTVLDKCVEIHTNNKKDFEIPENISKEEKTELKKSQQFRDILIFVKGAMDIRLLKDGINRLNSKNEFFRKYPVIALGLNSESVEMASTDYRDALQKDISELSVKVIEKFKDGHKKEYTKKATRRIIIATNVAETGVTIETLKYVIDTGYHKSKEYNPCFSAKFMLIKSVTRAMYKQRRGRVGRKAPGVSYAMFTEKVYNNMLENRYPDMVHNDITWDLLTIIIKEVDKDMEVNKNSIHDLFLNETDIEVYKNKLEGKNIIESLTNKNKLNKKKSNSLSLWSEFKKKINETDLDIYKLDLLDVPPADSLHHSMSTLYSLGAINSNSIPTEIGFIINKFRFIRIESVKMIIAGYAWNAPILDLITIASFLEFSFRDLIPEENLAKFRKAREDGRFSLFGKQQKSVIKYSELKTELFMNDEFIEFVFIFQELVSKILEFNITNLKNTDIIGELTGWTEENGLNIFTLFKIIEIRDSIIMNTCIVGLDPYFNAEKSYSHTNISEFADDKEKMDYIKIMKQCIFEGYKNNIARWNPVYKTYYARNSQLPLIIESELIQTEFDIAKYGDNNPQYIIFNAIDYSFIPRRQRYESEVQYISVLDGFISIDPYFDALV